MGSRLISWQGRLQLNVALAASVIIGKIHSWNKSTRFNSKLFDGMLVVMWKKCNSNSNNIHHGRHKKVPVRWCHVVHSHSKGSWSKQNIHHNNQRHDIYHRCPDIMRNESLCHQMTRHQERWSKYTHFQGRLLLLLLVYSWTMALMMFSFSPLGIYTLHIWYHVNNLFFYILHGIHFFYF